MAKGGFYAVAEGRTVGVFRSWGDCEAQISGYPRAKFKKFASQAEAQMFIDDFRCRRPTASPVAAGSKRTIDETDNAVNDAEEPPKQRAKQGAKFYAVARGHSTGVVSSMEQVNKMIEGYPGEAVHKEFENKDAALAFLAGYQTGEKGSVAEILKAESKAAQKEKKSPEAGKQTKKPPVWYAVAKGKKTGVFTDWNEAKKQIDGVFSAKYKRFETREEAKAFMEQHEVAATTRPGDPDHMDPSTLVAFCDGSALQNGRRGCQAGYACIFPHNTEWNVAKELVEDKPTNNRAEYLAGLEAMKRANVEDPDKTRVLYIFSDSMLLIRSMTEWVGNWQKRGWKKADGSAVQNRDLLEKLVEEKGTRRVLWRHVKAHTGKQDWQSKWNDVADNAARNAAKGSAD